MACAFVAGVAIDVFEVLWATALQQNIPREALSRVASYDWLGSLALTPIALLAAGALAATIGLSGRDLGQRRPRRRRARSASSTRRSATCGPDARRHGREQPAA